MNTFVLFISTLNNDFYMACVLTVANHWYSVGIDFHTDLDIHRHQFYRLSVRFSE